ncbi:MAG: chemotaxis protein CheX [Magnetococcales bacterium]|nr:chemotaxis protein CheX [Magnetococcales bacterium]
MDMDRQSHLIKAIRDAMHETAMAFFATDLEIREGPAISRGERSSKHSAQTDVTAIVDFRGAMHGGIQLSAPLHAALGLASAFWGEPLEDFNDTARDALGELTNILAGAMKSRINDGLDLTPPRVLQGEAQDHFDNDLLDSTRCYFLTTNGPLFIELYYNPLDA